MRHEQWAPGGSDRNFEAELFSPLGKTRSGIEWGRVSLNDVWESRISYLCPGFIRPGGGGVRKLPPGPGGRTVWITWMNNHGTAAGVLLPKSAENPANDEASDQAFVWDEEHGYQVLVAPDARFDEVYVNDEGLAAATVLYYRYDYDVEARGRGGVYQNPITGTCWGYDYTVPSARLFERHSGEWRVIEPTSLLTEALAVRGHRAVLLAAHEGKKRERGFVSWVSPPDEDGKFHLKLRGLEGLTDAGYLTLENSAMRLG